MVTCLISDEGRIKAVGFNQEIEIKVVSTLKYLRRSSPSRSWGLPALIHSSPRHFITPDALFLFYDIFWHASTY